MYFQLKTFLNLTYAYTSDFNQTINKISTLETMFIWEKVMRKKLCVDTFSILKSVLWFNTLINVAKMIYQTIEFWRKWRKSKHNIISEVKTHLYENRLYMD